MTDYKEVRENNWLKVPMDSFTHNALHKAISFVPPPDRHTMQRVRKEFMPVRNDYIATAYDLIDTIDLASKHPKTQPLERAIAELTMKAIEMQIPFIQAGLVE